jgi:hypothetical protein
MMTAAERALRRAHLYWDAGSALPVDLFYELVGLGMDVETLEHKHRADPY